MMRLFLVVALSLFAVSAAQAFSPVVCEIKVPANPTEHWTIDGSTASATLSGKAFALPLLRHRKRGQVDQWQVKVGNETNPTGSQIEIRNRREISWITGTSELRGVCRS